MDEEMLKSLGHLFLNTVSKYFFWLGYLLKKAAMASTPTMDITNTGINWKIVTATILKSMTSEFEMVNAG